MARARRPRPRPGSPLRLPARRRRDARARPSVAVASPTASTVSARPTTRRRSPGPTPPGRAARSPASVIYELHIGTFTPEGTLDSAHRQARPPGRPRVSTWSSCCRSTRSTAAGTGATTASTGSRSPRTTAARRPTSASSTRRTRAGLGVVQDVVYNHLGPSGNYLPQFGPYLTDKHANTWGTGRQPRRRRLRRGALAHLSTTRCSGSTPTTSTACASMPFTRSSTTRRCTCSKSWPIRTDRAQQPSGPPPRLIAESDMNDASLVTPREAAGRPGAERLRNRRAVVRRLPPLGARRADRRDHRLLRRLRAVSAPSRRC